MQACKLASSLWKGKVMGQSFQKGASKLQEKKLTRGLLGIRLICRFHARADGVVA
jgi:hypothetical protein